MQQAKSAVITDRDGVRAKAEILSPAPNVDASEMLLQLEDGQQVLVPTDLLSSQDDGTYVLDASLSELNTKQREPQTRTVIPVIEEEAVIEKRPVERSKVRLIKRVHEHEELVDEPLLQEQVDVERVSVNRMIEAPASVRYEGDTMIVPLLEEVLVVEKRLMLKEELHVTKHRTERHQPERVRLRSEEITVERDDLLVEREDGDKAV